MGSREVGVREIPVMRRGTLPQNLFLRLSFLTGRLAAYPRVSDNNANRIQQVKRVTDEGIVNETEKAMPAIRRE